MKTMQQVCTEHVFSMMGKVFYFERLDSPIPELKNLGECRVTTVIVHENELPEIGLVAVSQQGNADTLEYYRFSELSFDHVN